MPILTEACRPELATNSVVCVGSLYSRFFATYAFELLRTLFYVHEAACVFVALGPGDFAHELALALGAPAYRTSAGLSPTGLLVATA